MKTYAITLIAALTLALAACGGGGSSEPTPTTLTAGQSFTIVSGETVEFPSGTVIESCGSSATINGDHNTVNVCAGAKFTVPTTATGPADNTATAS